MIWGNISLYIYSYFKMYNPNMKYKDFSLTLSVMAIPMALLALTSMKIMEKVGVFKFIVLGILNPLKF